MNKIILIYEWFIRTVLYFLPDIPIFMRFRGWLYSFSLQKCGYNFQITHNAIVRSSYSISIGNNVYIANNCVLLGGGIMELEDEVMIGPNCVIATRKHTQQNNSFRYGKAIIGTISIGRGAWIAANCTIVTNSLLPDYSVLGANSMLNKIFLNENSLYAGTPAKFIKKIERTDDNN